MWSIKMKLGFFLSLFFIYSCSLLASQVEGSKSVLEELAYREDALDRRLAVILKEFGSSSFASLQPLISRRRLCRSCKKKRSYCIETI